MKKLFEEFKKFAFKGSVIDMAVGVMIGAAFGNIVTSLVNDLFMPLLSLLSDRIDFSTMKVVLSDGEHAASVNYGAFLQALVNFLLIAVCVFAFVRFINVFKHEKPAEPARLCPYCQMEVAKHATRCPHCTSALPEESVISAGVDASASGGIAAT